MHRPSTGLLEDTRGLATIEYVVILALVAVAGVSAWQGFGTTVTNKIGLSAEAIAGINPPGTPTSGGGASLDGTSASAVPPGAGGQGADVTVSGGDNMWTKGGMLGPGDATGVEAAARALVDVGGEAVVGTAVAAGEAASWLWDRVTSPVESAAAVSAAVTHAVMNPRETGRAALNTAAMIGDGINKAVVDGVRACVGKDSYSCTRAVGTVFVSLIPGKALTTGAKSLTRIGNTRADRLSVVQRRADTSDIAPSHVIRDDMDGIDARDMIREGGDVREVVYTRGPDGTERLRTSDHHDGAAFPESETARAHNHPGAGDDPAWQNPSPADIDYVRETGGNHAIVHDRGVTVINERSHAGNDITDQVTNSATGEVTTSRYQNVRNVTRVDSNDVRISTDGNGQLRIDPLPDSAHPDYLPITVVRNERVGTELVPDPANNRWQRIEHNAGTDQRLPESTPTPLPRPPGT